MHMILTSVGKGEGTLYPVCLLAFTIILYRRKKQTDYDFITLVSLEVNSL